jgi:hypothetical protein
MKKALTILIIAVVCAVPASCIKITIAPLPAVSYETEESKPAMESAKPKDNTQSQSAQPSPAETQSAPPGFTGEAIVYIDPEIDMFIMVPDATWKYTKELYEGEVYFYPGNEDPTVSPNGFAISSQQKWEEGIKAVWESWEPSLRQHIDSFEWNEEDDVTVGNYTGCRYHFTSTAMDGDFILWEIDDLLYICSFSSDKQTYGEYYTLLVDALGSFKTFGEAGKE